MYSANSVKSSIEHLYNGAIHELGYKRSAVETLLEQIDFKVLAQAVAHNAKRVYGYVVKGNVPLPLEYRGRDLLEQRAVMLYEDVDRFSIGIVVLFHSLELWLKEDGTLVTVSCVTVSYLGGVLRTEYREIRGYPWGCGLDLNLEVLTEELRGMCAPVYQGKVPLYEL